MADTWLDTLKSGFGFFGPRAIPQPAPMQPGTSTNPMNAYFTQLADPRYRKAMQSQNLFSNLLNFGAQMSAAGAPSLDPGYAGRTRAGALAGLGKGLMSGNQAYRDQMMNAIKLKSMMDTSKRAQAMHAVDLKTKQADLAQRENWAKQWKLPPQAATAPQILPDPLGDIADTYSGQGVSGGTQVSPPKIGQVPEQFAALGINPEQWAAIGRLPIELGQKMLVNLVKPKTGAPKVVDLGPSGNVTDEGVPLHSFGVFDQGKQIKTYEAPRKSGISISLGEDKGFGGAFGKGRAADFNAQLDASRNAAEQMSTIAFLQGVVNQPGFKTGASEPAMLALKSWGASLGMDVDTSQIGSKQAFVAKTSELVLNAVSKMKGALSNKELGFLESQQAGLEKTPEGNKLLLWLQRHQLEKASKFSDFAYEWKNEDTDKGIYDDPKSRVRNYQRMMRDWRDSGVFKQNPYEYVVGLAEDEEARLTNEGRLNEIEIAQRLESQFSLSLLARIYPR